MLSGYLVLCARAMLAVVFAVSLTTKIRGRQPAAEFVTWLRQLAVIPPHLTGAASVTMVATEAAAIGLLAYPATSGAGLAFAGAILSAFAVAVAWIRRRRAPVPCRCFGASARPLAAFHVVRNITLALVAGSAAVAATVGPQPLLKPLLAALAVVSGAAGAVVAIHLDDIIDLFGPSHRVPPEPVAR